MSAGKDLQTVLVRVPLGGVPEWALIELQGTLGLESSQKSSDPLGVDVEEEKKDETLSGSRLGKLTFENGTPVLEIGYHRLEGKVVQLKKAQAVLKRKESEEDSESDDTHDATMQVLGMIRHKIQFKTRPKPLVNLKKQKT